MALMKELVKAMTSSVKEAREAGRRAEDCNAARGLADALKKGEISVHEWNIGHVGQELFGYDTWQSLRSESAEGIAKFFEAAGGVSTAAFANINKPFAYTAFLEPYSYPDRVFSQMIPATRLPQGSTKFLRIPGVTNIGRETMVVAEGDPYPLAGVSENYIETPEVVKRGAKVPVTKEAMFFDRTGQVVDQCRRVGDSMSLDREYRAVNCVVDIGESLTNGYYRYRWGKSTSGLATIATYGDNSGTHNWDNLAASNGLEDHTDLNTAWLRLLAQTDPFTGEPIYFQPKHLIAGPTLAFTIPKALNGVVTFADGGYPTNADAYRTEYPNPVRSIVGALTPVGTNSMIFENQNTTASAATTWYLGDITRAFGYLEAWAPQVDSLGMGTQQEFDRDIVMQFKVSEMGTFYTKEPRAIVKCTA